MREIKFRAWIDGKGWAEEVTVYSDGSWQCSYKENPDDEYSATIGCIADDNCHLMQYTGLQDKTGREIYEGDVVRYTPHPGYIMCEFTSEIKWMDDRGGFYFSSGLYDQFFSESDEPEKDLLSHMEVIGNIYENPDLLEQTDSKQKSESTEWKFSE